MATEKPQAKPKAKKGTTQLFYEAIEREYFRLIAIKDNNVRKYSEEWVMAELAKKFYREPRTIENILYGRA